MDKLELKHLAPYLPYNLNVQHKDGEIFLLTGFSSEHGNSFKMLELMDESFGKHFCNLVAAKPILRPLSDLDKYGEDIPNCHKLNLLLGGGDNYGKEYIQHCNGAIDLEIEIDSNYCSYYMLSYKVMQKINYFLVENLYDINDLIGQGLAIDINTIQS